MGKNRQDVGSRGGTSPNINYSEQNEEVFNEICNEKGVGPKAKAKLKEILEFCNENNLELTKGAVISSNEPNSWKYSFGGTARASIIDRESGKRISIFDDVLKGKNSSDINKDSLNNMLNGLRMEVEHTNSNFHNLYSEVLLTNHRLIQDNKGKWVKGGGLAFFDPYVPQAITICTSQLAQQHMVKVGKNSYDFRYDNVSAQRLSDVIAHENGHAYDFHIIGNGQRTGSHSIFTEHGKDSGTMGPCDYAKDYYGETISTMCEMVNSKHVRDDARLSSGTTISNAYMDKYGERPGHPPSSTEEKRMYKLWSNDPVWAPMIAEVERFML